MSEQLSAALEAETAAIYAYGLLGVRLANAGEQAEARSAEQAHRERRDYLVGVIPSPAALPAGYELPFPVGDRPSALKLAIHVEDGVAQAWRPILPAASATGRGTALAALTDAAVRATRWRRLAEVSPVTMPFPGLPERA